MAAQAAIPQLSRHEAYPKRARVEAAVGAHLADDVLRGRTHEEDPAFRSNESRTAARRYGSPSSAVRTTAAITDA